MGGEKVMWDKKCRIKQQKQKLKMTWKCVKISVDFDVSRWFFPETHVEDNSLEDERVIASKQIK